MTILVDGEVSNLSTPASGHLYFSLKDAKAQIRCAMFKNQQRKLGVKLENGKQITVQAQVSLYEPRGDYQLIVEHIEDAGHGALQQAFNVLKQNLAAAGLFDSQHKKSLPKIPQQIGIITSPSGAAIRDILTVLRRRFSAIPVVIYPVTVQGETAKHEISAAIITANQQALCDVLILARGGGSLEDLWAFNEEMVARAIFHSEIPIIAGIGHETDVTIADFVSDLRAATPSAAAEHATPEQEIWLSAFKQMELRLIQQWRRKLNANLQAMDWINKRLQQQHPGQKLVRNRQRINELSLRISQISLSILKHHQQTLAAKTAQLWQFNPALVIAKHKQSHQFLSTRLVAATQRKLEHATQRFLSASQTLNTVSPLATLNRGYSLTTLPTGKIIRSHDQIKLGDSVQTLLAKGRLTSRIEYIEPE
jgi:exodeoxyribonuclease VII large subunit